MVVDYYLQKLYGVKLNFYSFITKYSMFYVISSSHSYQQIKLKLQICYIHIKEMLVTISWPFILFYEIYHVLNISIVSNPLLS